MTSRAGVAFVHAHPDDEALFSAGTIAHYVDRGHRTLLVTCTDGRGGLDDRAAAGNSPRHHSDWTRVTRAGELAASVAMLGIDRHVCLGYRDSGLEGWPMSEHSDAFINADLDATARTVANLLDEEDVKVVVTYDENGYYGHPDHIRAHLVTLRAAELSSSLERVYFPVTPARVLEQFIPAAKLAGVTLPLWVLDAGEGVGDDDIDVTIDATQWAALKQRSIAAHASQVDNADLVTMDEDLFRLLFGREYYVLGWSRGPKPGALDDLCGGLS
jgi:LmbE family N-acetylglucosaminyl deacetylase